MKMGQQNYSLFDLVFKSLEGMLSSLTTGTTAIANQIISLGTQYNVLLLLFGLQASWLAVRLVIESDGFDVVTSFVRQIALYAVIFAALNNWSGLGFGLVNFANGWMTGAVVNASGSLTGGQAIASSVGNPVQALGAVQTVFSEKYKRLREEMEKRQKSVAEEVNNKSNWNNLFKIGDKFWAAVAVFIATLILDVANLFLWATMAFLVLFMFVGWIKALFGAAFGPFALYLLPLDRGRLLTTATSFILGGIGTYAFSLVIVMLTMNMFTTGAELAIKGTAANKSELADRDLAFAISLILLSILMLMVALLAKNWGAEFFGTMSFDLPTPRGTGIRRGGGRRDGGGGGGNKSDANDRGSSGSGSGGGGSKVASGGGVAVGGGGSRPSQYPQRGSP
jgi:hypothetical protein